MKLEIVIFDIDSQRKLVTVDAKKVFDYAGYSFYAHKCYDNPFATSITEKTSGLSVFAHTGTLRYIVDMAKDIVMGAKNLDQAISKAVTIKQTIIVTDMFKGAGIIQ